MEPLIALNSRETVLWRSVGWRARISKSEAGEIGRGQLGEASCVEFLDTVLQTAGSFLSREVSWSHTCFIKITVGNVEAWAGHGERESRSKQLALVITVVKSKCDSCHPSMVLLEFILYLHLGSATWQQRRQPLEMNCWLDLDLNHCGRYKPQRQGAGVES